MNDKPDNAERALLFAAFALAFSCVGYLVIAALRVADDRVAERDEFPQSVCLQWVEDETAASGLRCAMVLTRR